jgi:hypothetical protein
MLTSKGAGGLTVWFLGQLQDDVGKRMGADVPAAQQKEVSEALAALQNEARAGHVRLTDLPLLLESYKAALEDQKIDAAEAAEIAQTARSAVKSRSKTGTPKH